MNASSKKRNSASSPEALPAAKRPRPTRARKPVDHGFTVTSIRTRRTPRRRSNQSQSVDPEATDTDNEKMEELAAGEQAKAREEQPEVVEEQEEEQQQQQEEEQQQQQQEEEQQQQQEEEQREGQQQQQQQQQQESDTSSLFEADVSLFEDSMKQLDLLAEQRKRIMMGMAENSRDIVEKQRRAFDHLQEELDDKRAQLKQLQQQLAQTRRECNQIEATLAGADIEGTMVGALPLEPVQHFRIKAKDKLITFSANEKSFVVYEVLSRSEADQLGMAAVRAKSIAGASMAHEMTFPKQTRWYPVSAVSLGLVTALEDRELKRFINDLR